MGPVRSIMTELSIPDAAIKVRPYTYHVRKRHKSSVAHRGSPILVCKGITEISAKNISSGCLMSKEFTDFILFYYEQMK